MSKTALAFIICGLLMFTNNLLAEDIQVIPAFPTTPGTPDTGNTLAPPPAVIPDPNAQTLDSGQKSRPADTNLMEKCHVVDKNGNGLIRAYMADSGVNLEGDASAWIWVPYGQCKQINAGNFSGVSQEIRNKIQTSNVQFADTLE